MFRLTVALAAVFTVLALAGVASADSPHFKQGSPSAVTDNGLTFSQKASVAGLGNGDIVVTLSITNVQPTARCVNPAGQTKVPGQNPAPTTAIGGVAIPGSDIKNGTLTITVSTAPPSPNPIPGAPDCPNSSWTENITDMSLTSSSVATLTFYSDLNGNGSVDSGEPVILTATTP
jgi:FlaG/FlaF family flagellin (archaellin)